MPRQMPLRRDELIVLPRDLVRDILDRRLSSGEKLNIPLRLDSQG